MKENYWKEKYKPFWGIAAKKEDKIKLIIEKECNCTCQYSGLGAGSTEYLPGSAESRGYERGGSDLKVMGTNIFVEVTGPNVDYVGKEAPLWIRPDKVQNAIDNPKNDVWVVHVLQKDFFIRVIHIDNKFKNALLNNQFKIDSPVIRGARESYISIPANWKYITNIESLCSSIQKALAQK